MNPSHNMSDDSGIEPFGTDIRKQVVAKVVRTTAREMGMPDSKALCTHQRLIEDVRTRSGKLTGKVRCLECGTVFNDPYNRMV